MNARRFDSSRGKTMISPPAMEPKLKEQKTRTVARARRKVHI